MDKTYKTISIGHAIIMCICCMAMVGKAHAQAGNATFRVFEKIQLSSTFYAEGAGIGDLNQDGHPDVVAGPYWYEGPDFKNKHAFYEPKTFDPRRYSDNFIVGIDDVNGDGRDDILIVGFPDEAAYWYENPREPSEQTYWDRHLIHPHVHNESPQFYDLNRDGRLELVFHTDGYLGYAESEAANPTESWKFRRISTQHEWGKYTHGLGIGDIDGDGLEDIIKNDGWWENPGLDRLESQWTYHQVDFGPGGAQMFTYDVDADGQNDVVTTWKAHGWGLAWFKRSSSSGEIQFERNLIMGEQLSDNPYGVRFSQPHALDLVDMDNDGIKDLVTGKRFWAHGPLGGLEPNAPAVVYWFKLTRRENGQVHFVPYLVDDSSGVGVQVATGDVTGNGYPDIVTCNKNGTFVFLNTSAEE